MEVIKNKFKEQVFVTEAVRYHFNLRSPKSRKPTPIFMVIRVDGKQYKIPTGVKVLPDHWSKKMQVAYVGNRLSLLENSNNLIVNERLDTLIERFSEFLEYLCTVPEKIGNIEILKNHLYMGRSKKPELSLIQHFTNWCWERNESTCKNYLGQVKWLENFIATRADKDTISFSTVATSKFFREFQAWLVENMKNKDGKGAKPESINKTISTIYTLLKGAVEKDFITNSEYLNVAVKKLKDKSDVNVPFLYNSEVMQLFRYECKDKMDAIAKDVFLLECTTGQRISDVKGLSENVQEGENGLLILDLLTKKESTRVRVRLLFDIARKILIDKYNYNVPSISDAQINKRIKEIAHQAGLNRPWKKTRHEVGDTTGKPTEIEKPLYQFITTHVGRHTFDCLLKMRGYSYEDIARYAGHNVDMVKRYTDNCTDVDIDNYELTKVNAPENIVKLISEVDTPKEETTTIQMKQGLSDMGKILEFVNSKLDAFIAIEQINTDTKDFITQNKLDFTWYGGSSFNAYRPKMEKQYKENFEQIISVLDAVMQGMGNAVVKEEKTKPITKAHKTKEHIIKLQNIVNEALEIAPTKTFDKIKSETGNDNTITNEERGFIIGSSEKLRFVAQIIAPTCKVMTAIVESRPIDFFNDYYNRRLDDSLKATWNEVYNGLSAFPKETAVSLLKKAPIATNMFSLIADTYTNNNEKEFVRLFNSCTDDLSQYNKTLNSLIETKQFLDTLSDGITDDFEETVSYQTDPMIKEFIGDEDAKEYNEKVIDPVIRGVQAISEITEFLELDNKERIEYVRRNIGKDKMTDIDNATNTLMATLMFRVIQNYISMKPLLLRKENSIIENLLHKDEVFKEFVNVIYESVISSDKWFSLDEDFFNAKNRQTDNDTYIGELEGFVIQGGVEKFVSFLNYLGSNGYIEDTPENKTIYAHILTGYGKLSTVPVVEWKKAPNVLGYILSEFYFQGKQFVNAKKLIRINGKLHTATSLTNKNREFAEFVKELYGLTPDILKKES